MLLSRSCSYHLRDLRRIRSTLNFKTASTIATSLVQSKLDYCNSLYLNLPEYHLNKLQVIQNNMARAVTCKRKFDHISPTLQSLHWLKVKQRIDYKIISLTYSALQFGQPKYIRRLITVKPLAQAISSLWFVRQFPGSRSLIAPSITKLLSSGIPYLLTSVNLLHYLQTQSVPTQVYSLSPVVISWHSSRPTYSISLIHHLCKQSAVTSSSNPSRPRLSLTRFL